MAGSNRNRLPDRSEAVSTVRSIVELGRETEISFQAASVAFFAFVSLLPTLLLIMAVGSAFAGDLFAERFLTTVGGYLSTEGQQVVTEAIEDPSGRVGASTVGLFGLLWSTLKVFRAIDIAFDQIYRAESNSSLPEQIINGLIVLLAIAIGVMLLLIVQISLRRLALLDIPLLNPIGYLFLLGSLVAVFLPLYYVMPPVTVSVREVLPGTVTAVVSWLLLQELFQLYAANAAQFRTFGFVGAVLLFLLWLYFSALVLLFGAVVNVATSNRLGKISAGD